MGRRKIEIKAIKDDRNRSVTFLKRKGGLFKKAHELSVLCSVDVTVIIFGHNKKLYEFSSGDIQETLGRYQYYGQPHEHKGPGDFAGKQNLGDDDDEDEVSPDELPVTQARNGNIPPHQQAFQHVNQHHHTPSVSPPIPNGVQYHPRNGTPQPPGINSRPSSRNTVPAVSSNLAPPQHHHATPPPPHQAQNGYYMPNPSVYNHNQTNPNLPHPPRPNQYQYARPPPPGSHQPQPPSTGPHHPPSQTLPPHLQHQQHPHPPQHPPQHPNQHPHPHQHPQHHPPPPAQHPPLSHNPYIQEQQRRQSMASAYHSQERHGPPPPEQSMPRPQPQPDKTEAPSAAPRPQPIKSRSIFTPIDDGGSVLARQFGFGSLAESPKTETPANKHEFEKPAKTSAPSTRGHSISGPAPKSLPNPQRTHSMSSIPEINPSRNNSVARDGRPRLTVQIPSEHSDTGEATEESARSSGHAGVTPAKGGSDPGHSAVVLPPPSPSASALLSAGAHGPPNPFARPPPPGSVPQSSTGFNASNAMDTPMSALPSRFVADGLLPSPSSFYPDWGFGRSGPDSSMLPSPLTFPTPVMPSGSGFSKESEDQDRKRKSPDNGPGLSEPVGVGKRLKVGE